MEGRSARRTQIERRSETERKVLDAAVALIADGGSRHLSLAEVGRVAGYSRGIVNHQFGTKNQLLEAVVRATQQFDVPELAGTGLDRLTIVVETYLGTLPARAPQWKAFLLLWADAIAGDPVLAPIYQERDTWFRTLLADLVRDGVSDGSIRRDVDADSTALSLLGMLRGISLQLMSSAKEASAATISAQATDMVRHGLQAH